MAKATTAALRQLLNITKQVTNMWWYSLPEGRSKPRGKPLVIFACTLELGIFKSVKYFVVFFFYLLASNARQHVGVQTVDDFKQLARRNRRRVNDFLNALLVQVVVSRRNVNESLEKRDVIWNNVKEKRIKRTATSRRFIWWQTFMSRCGPLTLRSTAVRKSSSKRTVAAELKTIETSSQRSFKSSGEIPKPSRVTSPATGITLSMAWGRSRRKFSKTCL